MTIAADAERLRALFARPGLARLHARLRRRLERGVAGAARVTLPDATEPERREIAGLLGRAPGRGRSVSVPVAEIEAVLRRGALAPDLRTALEATGGPLRDLVAERATAEGEWARVVGDAHADAARAGALEWLDRLRRDGLLKRLANGDPHTAAGLLAQALAVLAELPGDGQTLSTLAARVLGDAHALDPSRPVATLVKRFLRDRTPADEHAPEGERELWADAGIVVGGAVTSTVLVLNLLAAGDSATARILRAAGEVGQPVWLTLRQLVQAPARWRVAGSRVYVCENPAVIAEAADRLGARCAPLVCAGGQPSAAVNHLLSGLREAGADLAYHGDFDWAGVRIANMVMGRFGARAWSYDAAAYLAAAAAGGAPLDGNPVEPVWDPALARAMREARVAVPEERVLDALLASLG